ncbi:MAG: TRAP transporter small permease subunit [Deltaproteobacteria bacterium]|nr:TRAP transporter small permease subunit [Candidatus Anaeroferrophillacea bacterium]
MQWYVRAIDNVNRLIGNIFCWLMLPLVCITTFEVFMRYVMKRPTIWAWDANIQVFAAIIFLGGGYALLEKSHVMVDVFTINMTKRRLALLNLLTSVFFFFGMGVLVFGGWEMFKMSWKVKEHMPTIWAPPYYWMKLLVPVGALLLFLQGISEFIKNIYILLGKEIDREGGSR